MRNCCFSELEAWYKLIGDGVSEQCYVWYIINVPNDSITKIDFHFF